MWLREALTDLSVMLGLALAFDMSGGFWRAVVIGGVVFAVRRIAKQEARRG